MTAIALRPYEGTALEDGRAAFRDGAHRLLLASPTGCSKTIMFVWLAGEMARRGKRGLILGHCQEIVEQISAALGQIGVAHGIVAAGHPFEGAPPVLVASVATLLRRLDGWVNEFDLVVVDEAHHAVAGSWGRILERFPKTFRLGVTATPERLDGKRLGAAFEKLILRPQRQGFGRTRLSRAGVDLCPGRGARSLRNKIRAGDYAQESLAAAMSEGVLVGNAVEHYARLCLRAPALVYCVGIDHSELVVQRFRAAGFRARHTEGEMPKDERRDAVAALAAGELDLLANCRLFSEGVDVPALGAVVLLRPTKSLGLYLQMVGRALRPAFGKERTIILDHAGNSWRHGLYDFDRTWSLEDKPRRSGEAPVRQCPECGALVLLSAQECPECGVELQRQRKTTIEEGAGELEEVTGISVELRRMPYRRALSWAGADPERLRLVARARGYKLGWVWHVRIAQHFAAGATKDRGT
jgi:DNA repair protein RadD